MDTPADEQPPAFKPRHTIAQKALLTINVVIVLACVVGAVVLLYGKAQLDRRLQVEQFVVNTSVLATTPASTLVGETTIVPTGGTFPPADPAAKNFLITGSDANACVDPHSQWSGAADPARDNIGMRSDTIMVMRVDPASHQAAVLSFPRDLWLKIPGRSDNRINTAYVQNDYTLLAKTLYANFGIVVDHYIQVDFCAFKRIVDAVGGVAVPFNTPIRDPHTGIDIKTTGCHVFHGDEALAYARSRHLQWVDANGVSHEDRASDLGRISRQQDFLRRVLQSALEKGKFDPAIVRALIKSLQTDIRTESGFSVNDMLKFAGVLHDIKPGSITTYQIEATGRKISGNAVLMPNKTSANMKAVLAVFQGKTQLAAAPDQVFETTTVNPGSDTSGAATTSVTTTTVKKGSGGSTTTVNPVENSKGDIIPPKDVVC